MPGKVAAGHPVLWMRTTTVRRGKQPLQCLEAQVTTVGYLSLDERLFSIHIHIDILLIKLIVVIRAMFELVRVRVRVYVILHYI